MQTINFKLQVKQALQAIFYWRSNQVGICLQAWVIGFSLWKLTLQRRSYSKLRKSNMELNTLSKWEANMHKWMWCSKKLTFPRMQSTLYRIKLHAPTWWAKLCTQKKCDSFILHLSKCCLKYNIILFEIIKSLFININKWRKGKMGVVFGIGTPLACLKRS